MNMDHYQSVYDQYFRLARKAAYDVLKDYHLAGDVAQEVFFEIFLRKEEIDEEQILYWILFYANHRAIDVYRKLCKMPETSVEHDRLNELRYESVNVPEAFVLQKEEVELKYWILRELRKYNQQWYEILMRIHTEGATYQDLARTFGVEEGNLRVQVCRARKWMSKMLRRFYDD